MVCLDFEPVAAVPMVGADETTELWLPPNVFVSVFQYVFQGTLPHLVNIRLAMLLNDQKMGG